MASKMCPLLGCLCFPIKQPMFCKNIRTKEDMVRDSTGLRWSTTHNSINFVLDISHSQVCIRPITDRMASRRRTSLTTKLSHSFTCRLLQHCDYLILLLRDVTVMDWLQLPMPSWDKSSRRPEGISGRAWWVFEKRTFETKKYGMHLDSQV